MKKRINLKLLAAVLAVFANFWIWRVLGRSLPLGVGLAVLSFAVIFRLKYLTTALFIVLAVFLIKTNPDTNLLYISPLEKYWLVQRYEYYAEGLGKLYRNRVGIYLHYEVFPYMFKYQRNVAYNLDPNLYFFAGHPRERGGLIEFEKFPFVFLPIFLAGLYFLITRGDNFLVFYLVASELVSGFVFPGYDLGPLLIFPFTVAVLFLGAWQIVTKRYAH